MLTTTCPRSARYRVRLSAALALALIGCPSSDEEPSPPVDMAAPDDLACSLSPRTHLEFLNACTTAQSVDKRPLLPLLRRDGTLPPLP